MVEIHETTYRGINGYAIEDEMYSIIANQDGKIIDILYLRDMEQKIRRGCPIENVPHVTENDVRRLVHDEQKQLA